MYSTIFTVPLELSWSGQFAISDKIGVALPQMHHELGSFKGL